MVKIGSTLCFYNLYLGSDFTFALGHGIYIPASMRQRQAPFPHPTTWLVIIALGFLGPLGSHREFFPLTGSGGFLLLAQVLMISAGMGAPSEIGRSKRNQSREFVSKLPPSSKG